jgi:hypothetical protein
MPLTYFITWAPKIVVQKKYLKLVFVGLLNKQATTYLFGNKISK